MRRTWQSIEDGDGPMLLNGDPLLVPEVQIRIVEYWVAAGRP